MEALTVAEPLRAYMLDAAFANGYDDVSGRIPVGKSADFVVLDRDLFAVDAVDLGDLTVQMTVSAGDVVYPRS